MPRARRSCRESGRRAASYSSCRYCQMPESGNYLGIGIALERHDYVRQFLQRQPFPGREFRFMRIKVDVAVLAGETQREPLLALTAIPAVKGDTHQMRRQIVGDPFVHLGDDNGLGG